MALKKFKPTTPTRRHTVMLDNSRLSKVAPIRKLTVGLKQRAGRNNQGRITVRHRGGRVKVKYRIIDFRRDKLEVVGVVKAIEYDPNRNANIARVLYSDGEWRYILAPSGIKVGDTIISSDEVVELKPGNATTLSNIPSGTIVHNVELLPGGGGIIARSAGNRVTVRGNTGKGYVIVKMPSGEIRMINEKCRATIGYVGNEDFVNVKIGKAGRNRHLGKRPEVRGKAMHAEQHPHGGGEANNGIHIAKDIWGHRIGTKTRKNK